MSHMNEIIQKNIDFLNIYNRSYRLAAAVFMISNVMDQDEELRTKIKNLSLELVSMSVNLKDTDFGYAKKLTENIEKNSLELMSMLDIASIAGLISKMNAGILKEEFKSFILELGKFTEKFEDNKNLSVRSIFEQSQILNTNNNLEKTNFRYGVKDNLLYGGEMRNMQTNGKENGGKNGNGHKRKDLRKNTILEFIKGHNNVSIKDIVPNIIGCSEKTVQRELISLINENKIKKIGERRWSKYSIVT
ncbi:hypothetical protein A2862_01735 [Candidatus Roizmanbacteria bacterium RIFCSPHIGHO2_01_FULL_38_41]|uniref:HTH deoR-type domain-containing protein n=1 Tax=Candidatus Zambryskibacteria bacterium RIFCSPLOWO2_12_FULL_39_16 TaxID=1802775 RepID=A0A1G2US77_9BACT|nr:MAG: hypothetical protein A2862_01735 [Candidatus Roizmanbacteria bacterium RIFCSPHIGHO2_01_FULL_38_41]OHA97454.1 MAG: hypothetical protein A3E02_00250 [Candidatus Zambryskibacteria bacterium RIFCSPHIGHO2_12_FULL_38_34]OHB12257.1 MAG: hypothetical protein A3G46_01385 [Candidatus Zambryskibacteria bacterium RIFCSPLOWO2_12_FULL_39_16]